jgi:long-chain acyl-CoA synthetase
MFKLKSFFYLCTMEIQRTFDLLDRYQTLFPKEDAFGIKVNKKWKTYSTQEYIEYSHFFSYGLLKMGFKKGDKIASIAHNRPVWIFIDMGMSMVGVVHVPLYTSLSSSDYIEIINHSDAKMLIVGDAPLYKKIKPIVELLPQVATIYTFDVVSEAPCWEEIVALGKACKNEFESLLKEIKNSISVKDCASLIYTSGTTGTSKGVMLSHENLVKNFLAAAAIFQLTPDQRYLSILPLCHVGGRMGNYQTQYCGTSIYYAENMGTIAADMKDICPHGFDAVPRILEKIYDTIISKGKKLTGMKKKLFFWAVDLGLNYKIPEESSVIYKFKLKIADKLIFSKWRAAIGGNIESVGCGGASLPAHIERIFWAAGIKILNMYGLTETSPVITINRKTLPELRLGSVGTVIEGVEVKIADDGEIMCKGHDVMMGYYKNPELTAQVFTEDHWFKTGDIGHLADGKYLYVTDRKKEIFKLSNGKFVAPQPIEIRYKNSLLIENLMVIGEHKKYASAIIEPNYAYLNDWIKTNNIQIQNQEDLIHCKEVYDLFKSEVHRINKSVSEFEKIVKFKLVPDQWSPNTGELSPTLKLKRSFISNKYKHLIEEIYG